MGLNPPPLCTNTSKTRGVGLAYPVRVEIFGKLRGEVELTPFGSKHVENEWGEVEPTPFASKLIENNRGGVKPTPLASRPVKNIWGEVELTLLVSKHVESEGGVELCRNRLHFKTCWPDVILARF